MTRSTSIILRVAAAAGAFLLAHTNADGMEKHMATCIASEEERERFVKRFREMGASVRIFDGAPANPASSLPLEPRFPTRFHLPRFAHGSLAVGWHQEGDITPFMELVAECPYVSRLLLPRRRTSDRELVLLRGHVGIQQITVGRNVITDSGVSVLSSMPNLEAFYGGDYNPTNAGLKLLSGCRRLRILSLMGGECTDDGMQPLSRLEMLERLDLTGVPIRRGVTALQRLRLSSLVLSKTQIDDLSLRDISCIKSLRELLVGDTAVTDKGLQHVSTIEAIEHLSLCNTRVSAKGLWHLSMLPKLQELNLSGVPLDSSSVAALCECQSLQSLHVTGTGISATQLGQLYEAMPEECEIFADSEIEERANQE